MAHAYKVSIQGVKVEAGGLAFKDIFSYLRSWRPAGIYETLLLKSNKPSEKNE